MIKHILIHTALIAVFVSLLKYSEVSRFRLFLYYFFCVAFFISDSFHETHEIHPAQGYNYKSVIIGANDKGESIRKFW
jgi:undecaprenyl-phosphate galactose phosphotransferase/putative colanic acid biosynthesis UDP-glucose lipid carrier transferase